MVERRVIELKDYEQRPLPRGVLSEEEGEARWRRYGDQVAVDFPTVKTNRQWRLTSQAWVGFIPLTPELGIWLAPKVPLGNLLRILKVAYKLDFLTPEGLTDCGSRGGWGGSSRSSPRTRTGRAWSTEAH